MNVVLTPQPKGDPHITTTQRAQRKRNATRTTRTTWKENRTVESPNKLITDQTIESMHAESVRVAARREANRATAAEAARLDLLDAKNGNGFDVDQRLFGYAADLIDDRDMSPWFTSKNGGSRVYTVRRWPSLVGASPTADIVPSMLVKVTYADWPGVRNALKAALVAKGIEIAGQHARKGQARLTAPTNPNDPNVKTQHAHGAISILTCDAKQRGGTYVAPAANVAPATESDELDDDDPLE